MSIILCIGLFLCFALTEFLFAKMSKRKIIRVIPMLVATTGSLVAIALHIYALLTYSFGAVSKSVLAENQYFATFILIPAGICLIGSLAGYWIAKLFK